jgi:tRNA splicing endonuclease
MNLSQEDKILLQELCEQQDISFEKVLKLLETVQEYELKDRRTGVYDALRELLKSGKTTRNEV